MLFAAALVWAAATMQAAASEGDLSSGLSYLRAGEQARAEAALTRYLDAERDPAVRASITRVLPLLKQPLSGDVREYLASSIEERVGARPVGAADKSGRPNYWSRIFPVFP